MAAACRRARRVFSGEVSLHRDWKSGDWPGSEQVEDGRVGGIEQVGEVVDALARGEPLQELDGALLEPLQLVDVFFADLVVQLALQLIVRLQMARTDPERLFVQLAGQQAHQLHRQLPLCVLGGPTSAHMEARKEWIRAEAVDREELDGRDGARGAVGRVVASVRSPVPMEINLAHSLARPQHGEPAGLEVELGPAEEHATQVGHLLQNLTRFREEGWSLVVRLALMVLHKLRLALRRLAPLPTSAL